MNKFIKSVVSGILLISALSVYQMCAFANTDYCSILSEIIV